MISEGALIGKAGGIYGHLFENHAQDVPRAVYWAIGIEFEPLHIDSEAWPASLSWEWLTWPSGSWRALDGCRARVSPDHRDGETTLYLFGQHQWVDEAELTLRLLDTHRFQISVKARLDVTDLDGDIHENYTFTANTVGSLEGIVVVPDSLSPAPRTERDAQDCLAPFADVSTYHRPQWDRFRWVFTPNPESSQPMQTR